MSIQGQLLEVRVTGCRKLRDTEFFTRQDPYVRIEYGSNKFSTRTCTDGGRNPTFDEKFRIPLIEGLRELNISVWNSNTLTHDDLIGSGRVQLHKVLTCGYDDSSWPIQTRHMRSAGELTLVMHFDVSAVNKMGKSAATPTTHSVPPGPAPMPTLASAVPYTASSHSYAPPAGYPTIAPYQAYPNPYPASAYPHPPPQQVREHTAYPPTTYPPQPYGEPYPPQPLHGQTYPPQSYGQPYPPPSGQPTYPPAPYPGTYPPAPY
ncbi:hypothetical protein ABZP36_011257 [Zizania latifolia]